MTTSFPGKKAVERGCENGTFSVKMVNNIARGCKRINCNASRTTCTNSSGVIEAGSWLYQDQQ